MKNALDAIAAEWTEQTGKKATISYAASGTLAKQIENGAPAEVFASANTKWMNYLDGKKLIAPGTRKDLLGNTLVLVAPKDSTIDVKIEKGVRLAELLGDGKLAMGIPESVPAGAYAKAALTSLGVWDEVSPKVAGAVNVRAALAFVARGEAKLGIVYSTDAMPEPNVRVIATFPTGSHDPIVYPVALTATSSNPAAAEFLAYLSTPAAAKHFEKEGFTVLK